MLLSDRTIRELLASGDVHITPEPADERIQPISVDLTLGNSWVKEISENYDGFRLRMEHLVVAPGEFLLASTYERVLLPKHIAGFVHGKSSWARQGLLVEAAGVVDPGFDGTITLELFNMASHPIPLSAGFPICQMTLHAVDTAVLRPYGSEGLNSHYQGQTRAEPAR